MYPWTFSWDTVQFDGGFKVGKMYSVAPAWWLGFFLGQAAGTWNTWVKQLTARPRV